MTDSGFRLVIASANRDKAAEIISILSGALRGEVELIERPLTIPEVEETGASLEENARLKAVAISSATGMAAVADDTGLEVEALGGSPGVFSARFAGEHATYAHNVAKLLAALGQRTDREARFRTVALAVFPDGTEVLAEGEVTGRIAEAARGTAGFGYDPLFIPDEGDGRTFAELSAAEKQEISHRGRAFRALAQRLAELDRRTPDGPGGASLPSISPSGPR